MSLPPISYKAWHHPFSRDDWTLRQVRTDLARVGAAPQDIPLMVRLMENPKFRLPGFDIFPGRVDLYTHDCIHILLGRGLLPKDEAFVIGFTMGSTHSVSSTEEKLFAYISHNFYPGAYQFDDDDLEIFHDAVKLGYISRCQPLDQVDFSQFEDVSLRELRDRLGLEPELIQAYYAVEKRRFPDSAASRRLCD